MQAARAHVMETQSSRAASSTRPGYGCRQGPGIICSSNPGTKTMGDERPFAPCMLMIRTRGGNMAAAGGPPGTGAKKPWLWRALLPICADALVNLAACTTQNVSMKLQRKPLSGYRDSTQLE